MDYFDDNEVQPTMAEMFHRCLRCNEMACEIDKNVFKCSDNECGFEWEVKTIGKGSL
jgi:hypothetical protein